MGSYSLTSKNSIFSSSSEETSLSEVLLFLSYSYSVSLSVEYLSESFSLSYSLSKKINLYYFLKISKKFHVHRTLRLNLIDINSFSLIHKMHVSLVRSPYLLPQKLKKFFCPKEYIKNFFR